jgi:mono/diheme cytochrome c family protein
MRTRNGESRIAALLVTASVLGFTVMTTAQAPKPAPNVKRVAATPINSVEGRDNFLTYCAVCHGEDGKGNGPAAPAMKAPVPDLTHIARRHKGVFSTSDVEQIIRGTANTATPAHGAPEMPIWGDVFRNEDRARQTLRIGNLVKYLQSIQAPAGS